MRLLIGMLLVGPMVCVCVTQMGLRCAVACRVLSLNHQKIGLLRYASDGCVRKKKLDCKNKTDGFVKVPQAQL